MLVILAEPLGQVGWEVLTPPLSPEDVRGMHIDTDYSVTKGWKNNAKPRTGVQPLSWIWRDLSAVAQAAEDPGLNDGEYHPWIHAPRSLDCCPALRIEWCKARACAMWWSEEVTLLIEEMQQVCNFFAWQAAWWQGQASRHSSLSSVELDGMRAYALRQAAL